MANIDGRSVAKANESLLNIGFQSVGPNPIWYHCVVIAMLIEPSTAALITSNAHDVAAALGVSVDRSPALKGRNPDFHFGYAGPWKYFTSPGKDQHLGRHHSFNEIEPYCDSHQRSWRSSQTHGDLCTPKCRYGLRIVQALPLDEAPLLTASPMPKGGQQEVRRDTTLPAGPSRAMINLWGEIAAPSSWKPARDQWSNAIAPFDPRYPQPGYVGRNIGARGVVVLGTNPGTDAASRFSETDQAMFRLTLALSKKRTRANWDRLMDFQRDSIGKWTIFRNIRFPESFGVTLEEIAYFNVLHVNTQGEVNRAPKYLFRWAIQSFTSKQLALLKPRIVICLGKLAFDMLDAYWVDRPRDLKLVWMYHPSSIARNAPATRDTFLQQLDQARRAVQPA